MPGNQESTAWNPEFKAVSVFPYMRGEFLVDESQSTEAQPSRPSPVADQGEGLGGPGSPLISGSG